MICHEHGYHYVDDGGVIINLLDRLLRKWLEEVGLVEGLTIEDIKVLEDMSLIHSCYTCVWSEQGICGCRKDKEYMIPMNCPLEEYIDVDLEEVFNFEPRLFC